MDAVLSKVVCSFLILERSWKKSEGEWEKSRHITTLVCHRHSSCVNTSIVAAPKIQVFFRWHAVLSWLYMGADAEQSGLFTVNPVEK